MELYGLIGNPVSGSLSPKIQNAVLNRMGGIYLSFEVKRKNLNFAVNGLRVLSRGFNVTLPYKEDIIGILDSIDGYAKDILAVNTVKVDGSLLIGYNTDVSALIALINESIGSALIWGAGGAARAAAFALFRKGCNSFCIVDRSEVRARDVGNLVRSWGAAVTYGPCQMADAFVNATPMGMYADDSQMIELYKKGKYGLAIDLAYRVGGTTLQRVSTNTINGFDILIEQAAQSIKIWKGIEPERQLMKKAVLGE
ncbi:MAG: shikimate dehydrogenase family protein [Nitrososphaeria archaeon]